MQQAQFPSEQPEAVVAFWREAGPARWFRKDDSFDVQFRDRFLTAHEAARQGEFAAWSANASGALALLILLDQFPRNAFRGTARMFESDAQSLQIARDALNAGFDTQVEPELRNFFYLPFMHSEALADQERAVELARAIGGEALRYAIVHRDVIKKFGRFPHRNAVLGRVTTVDEQLFLDEGGFSG